MTQARASIWTSRNSLVLGLIVAGGILNYADRQIIAVLKPVLQHDLHWTDQDYGRLTSVFQLASAVALLGSGWLVDRIGWRRANPLAVGAWSLAAMSHAFARTLGAFTLARVALGASEALGTPTAVKTIAAVFPNEERALALGILNAANTIGAVITPLLIPLIALTIGWAGAFLVIGGLGLLWVGVWIVCAPGGRTHQPPKPAAMAGPRSPAGEGEAARAARPDSLVTVVFDRRTAAVAGAKVLSDQVWWLLLFWAPDLFHRVFHLSMAGFGVPLALMYAAAGAGSLIAGFASTRLLEAGVPLDRVRKGSLLVAALLATPVVFTPFVGSYWVATALLAATLAGHQAFSTNIFALAADISPASRVATVVSIGALCGNLSGMVILQAAGAVLGAGLGYGPLLALASVSYLLALGWVQVLLPRIVASAPDPEDP